MSDLASLYKQYAPRWVRAISWQAARERFVKKQIFYSKFIYLPALCVITFFNQVPFATALYLQRPQNKEELEALRRNHLNYNATQRNWDIDQYTLQMPPLYDMSERRSKYPEHYGDRYAGTKKQHVYTKTDVISPIPRRPEAPSS